MSQKIEITADKRADVGKGASRRLRRSGTKVPGIIYGGRHDAQPVTLDTIELSKAMQLESFFSQILTLKTDDGEQQAIVRDVQRHPATDRVTHIDFQRIDQSEQIELNVPLHFINEETCVGVRRGGGTIMHNLNEVGIRCMPANLPEFIEVDMANLDLGDAVYLSELKVPEGVQIVELAYGPDHDQVVVTIRAAREEVDVSEEEPAAGAVPTTREERSDED
jgi:large subunit ribosomal protein L25